MRLNILCIAMLGLFLCGCNKEVKVQGYNFGTAKSHSVEVGKSTEQNVLEALGTPTSQSEFGPKQFFYISRRVEQVAFFNPKVLEQDVLSLTFDKSNVVSHISHFTLDDGNNIVFARELTEIKGNTLTPVQQILTNVGKYRKK
jgi:outer membrane protein assembly factor BamE (lipoprotein component of BamABCDE complex)